MTRKVLTMVLALLLALTAMPVFTAGAESELPFVTIDWYFGQGEMDDCGIVNDAVNEYLKEKINANVNLHYWSGQEYWDKMTTMISAGQDVGIIGFGSQTKLDYVVQSQRGAYYPLEDMLDTIAPDTKALFKDNIWECMKIDGHIYGIPSLKDNGYFISLVYNADMLDDLGLKIEDYPFDNFRDLEELGYKVKELRDASEKYAEFKDYPVFWDTSLIYPYYFGFETFFNDQYFAVCNIDGINDIADVDCETVVNFYETPEFLEFALQKQRMVEDGIYDYDYSNKGERQYTGGMFGWVGWGYTYMQEHMYGENFTTKMKMFDKIWTDTNNFFSAGTAISAKCADPERAMMILNLVNTDPEFATMMRFGIEGVHYTYDADGKMTFDGTKNADPKNRAYYHWYMAPIGNLTIVHAPEELVGPDSIMLTRMIEYNNSCLTGNHMGFVVDPAPIVNEVAACTSVVSEYQGDLTRGQASSQDEVKELVEEFVDKLKANGVDTIVAEVQKQMDAWKAAK